MSAKGRRIVEVNIDVFDHLLKGHPMSELTTTAPRDITVLSIRPSSIKFGVYELEVESSSWSPTPVGAALEHEELIYTIRTGIEAVVAALRPTQCDECGANIDKP